jgi:hypothetical protein
MNARVAHWILYIIKNKQKKQKLIKEHEMKDKQSCDYLYGAI